MIAAGAATPGLKTIGAAISHRAGMSNGGRAALVATTRAGDTVADPNPP